MLHDTSQERQGQHRSIISTDNKGRFAFQRKRGWINAWPLCDVYTRTSFKGVIVAQKEGYHTVWLEYSTKKTNLKLKEPIRFNRLKNKRAAGSAVEVN